MSAHFPRWCGEFHFLRAHHEEEFTARGAEIVFLDCSATPPALLASHSDGVHSSGVHIGFFYTARDELFPGRAGLELAIDRFGNRKCSIVQNDAQDSDADFLQTFLEPLRRFAPGGIGLHDEDDSVRQLRELHQIGIRARGRRVDQNVIEMSSQLIKLYAHEIGIQRDSRVRLIPAASNHPEIAGSQRLRIAADGGALQHGFG
jgi:hypothetical protein